MEIVQKKVCTSVSLQIHEDLRVLAARQRSTIGEVLGQILDAALGGEQKPDASPPAQDSGERVQDHEADYAKLKKILTEGTPGPQGQIDGIRSNLNAFVAQIEYDKLMRKKSKPKPSSRQPRAAV